MHKLSISSSKAATAIERLGTAGITTGRQVVCGDGPPQWTLLIDDAQLDAALTAVPELTPADEAEVGGLDRATAALVVKLAGPAAGAPAQKWADGVLKGALGLVLDDLERLGKVKP